MKLVEIDQSLLNRALNEGFSWGKETQRDFSDGDVRAEASILG
jgi:Fe-S cluster assembly ATPase SufC